MKQATALVLTVILLLMSVVPAYAALPETATPYYANALQARVSCAISEDGEVNWTIICTGKASCTGISAVTYLEFQVGNSWVRIALDDGSTQYTYSTNGSYLIQNCSSTITGYGVYRAVVVFTVYGTAENETITLWNEQRFNG